MTSLRGISGDTESAVSEDKYKAGKEQNEKPLLKNVNKFLPQQTKY